MSIGNWAYWQRLRRSSRPILVGPWRTELGFETLYWQPWLAAWRERDKIAPERLIMVGRGGSGAWYGAGAVEELYDYAPPIQVRQAMLADAAETGSIKHRTVSEWDRTLLRLIAETRGISRYHVLHPSRMYHTLAPWWDGRMGSIELNHALRFTPLTVPHPPLTLPLPEVFIAAHFYARHTWPLTEANKDWVSHQLSALATRVPIVLLDSGLHLDDHCAFPVEHASFIRVASFCTPQTNLAVQSAVLAKAAGFIGTYGGTFQLAIRLGKPSVGLYEKFEGTCYAHRHLVEWLATQQGTPCFVGRPKDCQFLSEILPI